MTCTPRTSRRARLVLTLGALLAMPLAAGAVPPEPRPDASPTAGGGWSDLLRAPWQALEDLILGVTAASGTGEDPPPPPPPEPPEEEDDLKPPSTTCPSSQTPGGCTDPNG